MGLSEDAKKYIKEITRTKELYQRFANDKDYISLPKPVTFFMAGSPGAGKTEISKGFVRVGKEERSLSIVRIDADDIRALCPGYTGSNAHLFQEAASLGVNKLYDYVLDKRYNALIDGTFSSLKYAEENIRRALDKGRYVFILYVYQDPKIAWEFTLKREKIENRKISPEIFVKDFFAARDNVRSIKEKFGNKIVLQVFKKDYNNNSKEYWSDVDDIDKHVTFEYDEQTLYNIIKEIKLN